MNTHLADRPDLIWHATNTARIRDIDLYLDPGDEELRPEAYCLIFYEVLDSPQNMSLWEVEVPIEDVVRMNQDRGTHKLRDLKDVLCRVYIKGDDIYYVAPIVEN